MIYRDLFVNCNTCFSGQYDGLRKPMPEYHVKVAGFDERVGFYLIFFVLISATKDSKQASLCQSLGTMFQL